MTKEREALKMALEALEESHPEAYRHTITAIKEALAQPEQEPVQWGVDWGRAGETPCVSIIKRKPNGGIEVVAVEYGQPAQRNPLTDEDVNKLVDDEDWYNDPHGFVRAIEAAHGIKGEA